MSSPAPRRIATESECMEAWPDFPYPIRISGRREQGRVTISCLLSDMHHAWTLSPAPEGCRIQVRIEVPEAEAERLDAVREEVRTSLPRLIAVAERAARGS